MPPRGSQAPRHRGSRAWTASGDPVHPPDRRTGSPAARRRQAPEGASRLAPGPPARAGRLFVVVLVVQAARVLRRAGVVQEEAEQLLPGESVRELAERSARGSTRAHDGEAGPD